jgi:hypothetical protein
MAMSKYEPLKAFLRRQAGPEVPLSFNEIEQLVGFRLPRSARRYHPWWANENNGAHVQARAWLDAGWKTGRVDVPGERVVFTRISQSGSTSPRDAPGSEMTDVVTVDLAKLPPPAGRLVTDYARETGGDLAQAMARALAEAAVARRRRLIDRIMSTVEASSLDSVDLVREDRDGG